MLTAASEQIAYNYYPINFYDDREGHPRDTNLLTPANCNVNGIMNAVEIDVGNLAQWVGRTGSLRGKRQAGELFRSERIRAVFLGPPGHVARSQPGNITAGESGLEDVVNSGNRRGRRMDNWRLTLQLFGGRFRSEREAGQLGRRQTSAMASRQTLHST